MNDYRKFYFFFDEDYWENKFPSLPLEERKDVWTQNIYRSTRIECDDDGSPYYLLTKENYELWKKKFADMDEILDYVLAVLDSYEGGDGELVKELNEQMGRSR